MGPPTTDTTEAERFLQDTEALLEQINRGAWVPPGLSTGDGLAALDQTMRPVDRLTGEGLGWLVSDVSQLQAVLDAMAGTAGVVQTWADTSRHAAGKLEEIAAQLEARARAETEGWFGLAGARYRRRARELTLTLEGAGRTVLSASIMAHQMGELIADARRQVNERFTGLVEQLVSYVKQAEPVEGGVTPDIVARCKEMISAETGPILEIHETLQQALDAVRPPKLSTPDLLSDPQIVLNGIAKGIDAIANNYTRGTRLFMKRGGGGGSSRQPVRSVTKAQMVEKILNAPKTKIGQVQPPSRWPADIGVGNEMHQRIESVVHQRWPNVRFRPMQKRGPDIPVDRQPGQRTPTFDWVEVKPHTSDGIGKFVDSQWGQTAAWTRRGRLVTYDQAGNIYEVHIHTWTR